MPSTTPSLTLGGKIVAAAGVLFLITTFFPWYTVTAKVTGFSASQSSIAWKFVLPIIAGLLVLALLAEVIAVQLAKVALPARVAGFLAIGRLGVSVLAALLVLIELIKGQHVNLPNMPGLTGMSSTVDLGIHVSVSRGIGIYLGLVTVLILVVGNVLRVGETPVVAAPVAPGVPGGGTPPYPNQPQQFGQPNQPQQFGQPQPYPGQAPQYEQPQNPQQPQYPAQPQQFVQPQQYPSRPQQYGQQDPAPQVRNQPRPPEQDTTH